MARVKAKQKKKRDLGTEVDALKTELKALSLSVEGLRGLLDEKRLGEARFLTIEEVSAVIGVSVTSLRRMKARKELRYHRFGNVICFSPEDVQWMKKAFAVLETKKGRS